MSAEVLAVDPENPSPDAIGRAAEIVRSGGLVAFPTETVYGLGANALDASAVAKIFAAKGRPPTNPVIVHVADIAGAQEVVADWPSQAQRLAEKFWPGPLTLVLPKRDVVPDIVTAGGATVAVRAPQSAIALALIRAAHTPIAAPSANPSTRVSPTTAEHVRQMLGDRVDLILDGGPCRGGLESTVVDLTHSPPRLLRPGLVTPEQLRSVIGDLELPKSTIDEFAARSPGMMAKHYSPTAPLECIADARDRAEALLRQGKRVGWLAWDDESRPEHPDLVAIAAPRDPAAYSALLYTALHDFDAARVDVIVVSSPPETEAWLAVRDRLRRASQS